MLTFLLAAVISTGIHGTWTVLANGTDRVQFTMVRDHNNWGESLRRSELPLSDAQINASTETPVHFALNRDAGVIDFNGTFESGEGVGREMYSLTVDETFKHLDAVVNQPEVQPVT